MTELTQKLVRDAQAIWHAGLAAVDSAKLVSNAVALDGRRLRLGHNEIDVDKIRHIVVVVAGRAAVGVDCASQLPIVIMEMTLHNRQHFAIAKDLVPAYRLRVFNFPNTCGEAKMTSR